MISNNYVPSHTNVKANIFLLGERSSLMLHSIPWYSFVHFTFAVYIYKITHIFGNEYIFLKLTKHPRTQQKTAQTCNDPRCTITAIWHKLQVIAVSQTSNNIFCKLLPCKYRVHVMKGRALIKYQTNSGSSYWFVQILKTMYSMPSMKMETDA